MRDEVGEESRVAAATPASETRRPALPASRAPAAVAADRHRAPPSLSSAPDQDGNGGGGGHAEHPRRAEHGVNQRRQRLQCRCRSRPAAPPRSRTPWLSESPRQPVVRPARTSGRNQSARYCDSQSRREGENSTLAGFAGDAGREMGPRGIADCRTQIGPSDRFTARAAPLTGRRPSSGGRRARTPHFLETQQPVPPWKSPTLRQRGSACASSSRKRSRSFENVKPSSSRRRAKVRSLTDGKSAS
mgnify:CR=1 FL=1